MSTTERKRRLMKELMEYTNEVGCKDRETLEKAQACVDGLDDRQLTGCIIKLLELAAMALAVELLESMPDKKEPSTEEELEAAYAPYKAKAEEFKELEKKVAEGDVTVEIPDEFMLKMKI